jgi:hypothetical protein
MADTTSLNQQPNHSINLRNKFDYILICFKMKNAFF